MNAKPVAIELELTFEEDRPAGRAHRADAPERTFSGWLGLMAAIDALSADDPHPDPERNA